jgi:hypothetical protein
VAGPPRVNTDEASARGKSPITAECEGEGPIPRGASNRKEAGSPRPARAGALPGGRRRVRRVVIEPGHLGEAAGRGRGSNHDRPG